MKKIRFKLVALTALFLLVMTFVAPLTASAETQEPLPDEEVIVEETESDFTDIFYEKWLPIIVAVGTGAGAILVALFPLIRQWAKNKALQINLEGARGLYTALKKQAEDYEEKLKAASAVDYEGIIARIIGDKLKALDKYFEQDLSERQLLNEKVEKLTAAASIAWKEAPGANEILSAIPSATALKRTLLVKRKLEEYITQTKGEEADKIIAGIEADATEIVTL